MDHRPDALRLKVSLIREYVCTRVEERLDAFPVNGTRKQIALARPASELAELVELCGGLDTFRDDIDAEVLAKHQNGLDDRAALGVLINHKDERPVDLESLESK